MATCLSNPDVAPVSALRFRAPVAILFACFACRAIAQPTSACHAPQALESGVHAEPTARNWAALAGWFAEQNKFSCAIPAFRQALRIDPSSARLHYFLGLSLSSTGNNAESLVELRRSIQLDGSALEPRLLEGIVLNESGRRAEAEEAWEAALRIDPSSAQALDWLVEHDTFKQAGFRALPSSCMERRSSTSDSALLPVELRLRPRK